MESRVNATLKIKDKWLQIVISVRNQRQRQKAVQWGRGGKCPIKPSCKG